MVLSALQWCKRWPFQTVFASGMLLGLGGCGGDTSTTSDEATETPAASTTSPAAGIESPSAAPAAGMAGNAQSGMAMGAPGSMPVAPGGMGMNVPGSMEMTPPGGTSATIGGGAGYPGGIGAPATALRPDDFSIWTDQNFEDAVRERDPKVLDAIDARVSSSPGDPKVADLLTRLLIASSESPSPRAGAAGGGTAAYPGMANSSQGSGLPDYTNSVAGMQNPGRPAQLPAAGSGGSQSTMPTVPSSSSEAKKLFDLTAIPLVAGANPPKVRTDAKLSYSVTGSNTFDAFKFHEAQLVKAGWKLKPGGISTLKMFEQDGYVMTLNTSMFQPGVVTVELELEEL